MKPGFHAHRRVDSIVRERWKESLWKLVVVVAVVVVVVVVVVVGGGEGGRAVLVLYVYDCLFAGAREKENKPGVCSTRWREREREREVNARFECFVSCEF